MSPGLGGCAADLYPGVRAFRTHAWPSGASLSLSFLLGGGGRGPSLWSGEPVGHGSESQAQWHELAGRDRVLCDMGLCVQVGRGEGLGPWQRNHPA